ncbi:hypothetical protein PMPD1_2881 [Paramixta manurensis]|uniref:Uncharacterized protein n=1 Tax=Paramixta manurensis TaxID=2740817 RepID=A0A6M8UAS3_9GAMM|nr:hypothetical protein PMPD1_2881 [Erwiniaceae bacterium PD-1]
MDAKVIAEGIWDSLSSIPTSLYYGVKRTYISTGLLGSDRKTRNDYENERFFRMIKSLARNEEPLRRLVTIVITDFYNKLDGRGRETIHNKIGYGIGRLSGRMGGQIAVAQTIAALLIHRAKMAYAYKNFFRIASSFTINIALFQGVIEEAALASRRMQNHYPQTYDKVSPYGLDMIYFLVETPLKPYLDFINSHAMICKRVNDELFKIGQ